MPNKEESGSIAGHVLLVEDEPNIVESLRFILGRAGFRVSTAGDGDAALRSARADRPDLVMLDVMLPKRSGFEVLKWLKAQPELAAIPVLILTAKGQSQDRETAERLRADAFMTKPFSNKDVIACATRLVAAAAGSERRRAGRDGDPNSGGAV